MSKCEHGITSARCFVCASPKYAAAPQQQAEPSFDSTGAMAHAWFGTPGTDAAVQAVFGPQGQQAEPVAYRMKTDSGWHYQSTCDASLRTVMEPLYASPTPRLTAEQAAEIKRLAEALRRARPSVFEHGHYIMGDAPALELLTEIDTLLREYNASPASANTAQS